MKSTAITALWDMRSWSERELWSLDNSANPHALTKGPRAAFDSRTVDVTCRVLVEVYVWFECVESNFDYADESAEAGQEHLLPAPSCPAQGANFKLDGERTIMISLS